MNWDALGAIGEIVGALAVVVTLVFLTRQLSEHTKGLKLQALQSTFDSWDNLLKELQDPNGVGPALGKAQRNEELNEDEKHALNFWYRRALNVNDKVHYLHKIGSADEFNHGAFERNLPYIVNNKFFEEWWSQSKNRYSKRFQDYIREISNGL